MARIQPATRREFLSRWVGLIGVGAALPNFLIDGALAGPTARAGQRLLVVLQLSGGHDGLSAVVPYGNDDYARNRKATRISADAVLRLNNELGLHPNLTGFRDLLDQHALAVVQGVGYPNPNRSHFKSMDIWHLADNSSRPNSCGWIGRYCDSAFKGQPDPITAAAEKAATEKVAAEKAAVAKAAGEKAAAAKACGPGEMGLLLQRATVGIGKPGAKVVASRPCGAGFHRSRTATLIHRRVYP